MSWGQLTHTHTHTKKKNKGEKKNKNKSKSKFLVYMTVSERGNRLFESTNVVRLVTEVDCSAA